MFIVLPAGSGKNNELPAFLLNQAVRRQPMAAINYDYCSVDVAGRVGTKKYRRRFDIFDQSKPSERNRLLQLLFDRLRDQSLHSFGVSDWPRRDRVHANSVTSPLNGQVLRQRVDAGLRRGDVKLHRRAQVMQRGADVQNLAAVLFQFTERCPANIERPFQIDIHDGAETVRRKFFRRAEKISGGSVDDDVDFAKSFDSGRNGSLDLFGLANVGRDNKRFTDIL